MHHISHHLAYAPNRTILIIRLDFAEIVHEFGESIRHLLELPLATEDILVLDKERIVELLGSCVQLCREIRKHVLDLWWVQMLEVVAGIYLVLLIALQLVLASNHRQSRRHERRWWWAGRCRRLVTLRLAI